MLLDDNRMCLYEECQNKNIERGLFKIFFVAKMRLVSFSSSAEIFVATWFRSDEMRSTPEENFAQKFSAFI